ncbi:NrsF family protein [Dongia sp.]|uniref:NrsF family protein n=1 Tax=Dongia sp. TaxID=1977262 RepID=UPI0035B19501
MKTEDLIISLVADQTRPPASSRHMLGLLLPLALLVAFGIFVYTLDMREDFMLALGDWHYLAKIAVAASVAAIGLMLVARVARPEIAPAGLPVWILAALLPLAAGIAVESVTLPTSEWSRYAMGEAAIYCLTLVPLISLAPLAATLLALRHGAPQSPTAAGAVAGFAAGGLGALIYALHCNNDSPFYVAIWYLMAIGIVTLAGAVLGRSVLRW